MQTPPRILMTGAESILTVTSGSSIDLPCRVFGKPEPILHWERAHANQIAINNNKTYVDAVTGSLKFWTVDPSDGGEYVCVAINDAGEARKTVTLIVQGYIFVSFCVHSKRSRKLK